MLGRDVYLKPREEAIAAVLGGERIKRLRRIELLFCKVVLADRRHPEIDKLGKRVTAEAALGAVIHPVKHATESH